MRARLWAYPWDIVDEGPDAVMARVADAGFDEISVAAFYHGGMFLLPHNPRRKVYFPEDGVTYFVPDSGFYGGASLQPTASELTQDGDPLARICQAAEARGIGVVAWVVCLHNGRFGLDDPSLALQNAYGDHYPYALCPSQPRVAAFLEALVSDLSSRYPLAGIELEALYHQRYPHEWTHPKEGTSRSPFAADLLSLCFCPACLSAATDASVAADAVRRAVRSALEAELTGDPVSTPAANAPDELDVLIPGAEGYLGVRSQVVTSLLERLCAASRVPIHGLVGSGLLGRERLSGIELREWVDRCDSLTVNCYRSGGSPSVAGEITEARRRVGGAALRIGLHGTWPQVTTAAQLGERMVAVRASGADVAIYNYGLMPLRHVDWVKSAIAEVGE